MKEIEALFEDENIICKIRNRLPYMFYLAEQEVSKGGKIGMEVGTIREQIIIALFIYRFGSENVEVSPTNTAEFDFKLFGVPVSIKTKVGAIGKSIRKLSGSGIKLIWTVDWKK